LGTGQSSLFGSTAGSRAQVFELDNENVTLFEILTKAGGVGQYGFADRVKVVRGKSSNPTIFVVDLTQWDSFQQSNLVLQPNDIIYIEPLRRKSIEFLRDISQVTGILGTVLSIYLLTRL
jgi:polysaccharide export outer membrane protein